MKRIMIDKELCAGCLNCSLGCMAAHSDTGDSFYDLDLQDNKNESRNFVALDRNGKPVPIFCRHCDEPECVAACMSGAMTKDRETGVVSYDRDKCASCFMCVMSCPFGVLKTDEKTRKVIVKCDLCAGREGPRCVESCPSKAIYLVEVNAL
ncbi:carbon-monoxide dehydrogenase iron sulfur subunit [Sporobacter termitidis DSM 10068]|uniref:Carbon-monoxide dehydrogenase iron sulfur subunit n=1 Tax=Sporobacter termitidis DSM 10068 TaxID=1123282 RepID=A0A1M5XFS4_9FIRM|nr:4Fe-4S dicluster domain-containing protein [Sporobacter termitidis]SHH98670.1 carbon-monoxide dehydrogenase iron sulfur subunit [Sporobacter termitidis DSM 10068]